MTRTTKKPNRSGVALNASIDKEIREAVDAYIAAHNAVNEHPATIRSTLEAALRKYLEEKGFWPWPQPKAIKS